MRPPFLVRGLPIVVLAACGQQSPPPSKPLTVFAAASTQDVLRETGRRFEVQTGVKVAFSFDASSNLARAWLVLTICINEMGPSCMRAPPEAVTTSSGTR